MKKYAGFTLIELMFTVLLIGVLLSVGMPSLKTFMQGSQLVATSNDLVSAIHLARSEAIKLNARVTICESGNGTTCQTDGDWSDGWIVFLDADGGLDNSGSACTDINTDCLLRVQAGTGDPLLTVKGLNEAGDEISSFTFSSRGVPKDTVGIEQSGIFSVCSVDEDDNLVGSRAVVLGFSGRVRISDNAGVITCP